MSPKRAVFSLYNQPFVRGGDLSFRLNCPCWGAGEIQLAVSKPRLIALVSLQICKLNTYCSLYYSLVRLEGCFCCAALRWVILAVPKCFARVSIVTFLAERAQQLADAIFQSSAPSRRNRSSLRSKPPPNPVSDPSAPTTRWHGNTMGTGLRPLARPTARTAFGRPMSAACRP